MPHGPTRVFISYAHEPESAHGERVRELWLFLRANGIDARLDLTGSDVRRDWAQWMTREVRDADFVLVVASRSYRERAEGDAPPDEGRGVQWEAWLIRDRFYRDQAAGLWQILPVVLPGGFADDIPSWLAPAAATWYQVSGFTVPGAEKLLRALTGQASEEVPPLGSVSVLPPRTAWMSGNPDRGERAGLRTDVEVEAATDADGMVVSAVWVAGMLACRQREPLPTEVRSAWSALQLPPELAAERIADAGRRLGRVLFDDTAGKLVADLLYTLPAGDTIEIVLCASGDALTLPVELARLRTSGGAEVGPLGLLPGAGVSRRLAGQGAEPGASLPQADAAPPAQPGPLKILAAVSGPDETKTSNSPLDVEAEMQAVLDAVTDLAGPDRGQARILEVASLPAIR